MIVPKVNSKDVDVTGILYLISQHPKGFLCIRVPSLPEKYMTYEVISWRE